LLLELGDLGCHGFCLLLSEGSQRRIGDCCLCQLCVFKHVAFVLLTGVIQVDIVLGLRVAGENDTRVGRHDEVLWLVQ
jgi:hypothetical protein